jgi:hypothetical protein
MEVDLSRIEDFLKQERRTQRTLALSGQNAMAPISRTMPLSVKGLERRQNQQTNLDRPISLLIDWQFIHA